MTPALAVLVALAAAASALRCGPGTAYNPDTDRCEIIAAPNPARAVEHPMLETDGGSLSVVVPAQGGIFAVYGTAEEDARHVAGNSPDILRSALALGYQLGHDPHAVDSDAFAAAFTTSLGKGRLSLQVLQGDAKVGEVALSDNVDAAIRLGYELSQKAHQASATSLKARLEALGSSVSSQLAALKSRMDGVYRKDEVNLSPTAPLHLSVHPSPPPARPHRLFPTAPLPLPGTTIPLHPSAPLRFCPWHDGPQYSRRTAHLRCNVLPR